MELTAEYQRLGRVIDLAERHLALLQRATPLNFGAECARLARAWAQGQVGSPEWQYRRERINPEAIRALRVVKQEAKDLSDLGELLAERSVELLEEADLVNAVGTPQFASRARVRMRFDMVSPEADELARRWVATPSEPLPKTICVDDLQHPAALINVMQRELARVGLPLAVQVQRGLASIAAVTWGGVLISEGQETTELDAHRIAVHEIYGHAIPLWNAGQATASPLGALLQTGSAWGTETQEGWAVCMEHRFGLLHAWRRRTLGLRHLAARRTHTGASFVEVVRSFTEAGFTPEEIVPIVARAQRGADGRGGGLARESVYLIEALRVEEYWERQGQIDWFASGRLSLAAIERLTAWGYTPLTTGIGIDSPANSEILLRRLTPPAVPLRNL